MYLLPKIKKNYLFTHNDQAHPQIQKWQRESGACFHDQCQTYRKRLTLKYLRRHLFRIMIKWADALSGWATLMSTRIHATDIRVGLAVGGFPERPVKRPRHDGKKIHL